MKKEKNNKTAVGIFSFFSGAGFLDIGFEDAGFKTIVGNEELPFDAKQKDVVLTILKEGV